MKIDTTKIQGYDTMSAEEKLSALEDYEIAEPDYSGYVKKEVFDKTASELASTKKQLKSKLTQDEQDKLKEQKDREELEEKYNKLLHESEVSKFKAKYLAMGYDEKLAEETAEAYASGDTETVFNNQRKALDAIAKKARAESLKDTPRPTGDNNSKPISKEDFRKMSPSEQVKFYEEHTEEYKAMYNNTGGNE